jgi:hypothetical protein
MDGNQSLMIDGEWLRPLYSFRDSLNIDFSWLYALFIAIDACFRLQRKDVSTETQDPGLNHGFAYLVEEVAFRAYLREYDKRVVEEKSTCNNHDAIKSASTRGGRGLATSGLGMAQCSRHDMKRPTGAGDLHKGERYEVSWLEYAWYNSH